MKAFQLDSKIDRIEFAYDAEVTGIAAYRKIWPDTSEMMNAYCLQKWVEASTLAQKLFAHASNAQSKAFALQWAVGASELAYDIEQRNKLLRHWDEIPDWHSDPYCRYLNFYHTGLTHFFAGALRDAYSCFQAAYEECIQAQLVRGMIRTVFHLGLVERDQRNLDKAHDSFDKAKTIAKSRHATRWIARIEAQLKLLDPTREVSDTASSYHAPAQIEDAIRRKDFEKARSSLIREETLRRSQGVSRRLHSYYAFLALLLIARGRVQLGERIIARISDPALKLKILEMKHALFGKSSKDDHSLFLLRSKLGASSVLVSESGSFGQIEICGVRLDSVQDSEVHTLLTFLISQRKPSTKEEIYSHVWGPGYDPLTHDRKVYKLIQRAKKLFPQHELILNTYGAYQLNPAFFGLTSTLRTSA